MIAEPSHQATKKEAPPIPERAARLLASSIFENLCNEGYQPKDIIQVSSQLISLVTNELAKDS